MHGAVQESLSAHMTVKNNNSAWHLEILFLSVFKYVNEFISILEPLVSLYTTKTYYKPHFNLDYRYDFIARETYYYS